MKLRSESFNSIQVSSMETPPPPTTPKPNKTEPPNSNKIRQTYKKPTQPPKLVQLE